MQDAAPRITIGPQAIATIGLAVDRLLPWLTQSRFEVLESGNLRFEDEEPAEAVGLLREAVETFLPEPVRERLGQRSGLGWRIFFGHVVAWWLPQRRRVGFLRALVDRASLHQVRLDLLWNADRTLPVVSRRRGNDTLAIGAVVGIAAGIATTRLFPRDSALSLLVFAACVVIARVYQRVGRQRICGDALCRAPLGRARVCPSCGGAAEDRR